MKEKLKFLVLDDKWFYSALIIVVGFTAFGLGRWSVALEGGGEPLAKVGVTKVTPTTPKNTPSDPSLKSLSDTDPTPTLVSTSEQTNPTQANPYPSQNVTVVASKSGTKYHLPTCPGAKQIKPDNLITFATTEEAQASGYKPASNCPNLP